MYKKACPKEKYPLFRNKLDYKGDTNDKTHVYDDLPIETGGFVRNLSK